MSWQRNQRNTGVVEPSRKNAVHKINKRENNKSYSRDKCPSQPESEKITGPPVGIKQKTKENSTGRSTHAANKKIFQRSKKRRMGSKKNKPKNHSKNKGPKGRYSYRETSAGSQAAAVQRKQKVPRSSWSKKTIGGLSRARQPAASGKRRGQRPNHGSTSRGVQRKGPERLSSKADKRPID